MADDVPAVPIGIVPETRVLTAESRAALPEQVTHGDAAFTAGRAALLGAALASGSEELFAAALDDRLHEPYRSTLLTDVRRALPDGALGATLSGSGPTVIVWARRSAAHDCARALEQRFGAEQVVSFAVSRLGAGPTSL